MKTFRSFDSGPRPRQKAIRRQFRVTRYDATGVTDIGMWDDHGEAVDALTAEMGTRLDGQRLELELTAVVSRVIVAEDGRVTMERAQ